VPYLVAGIKTQCGEGDGRILLGSDIGSRAVMLRPIRFRRVAAWISTGLLVYTYTVGHTKLAPELPEHNC